MIGSLQIFFLYFFGTFTGRLFDAYGTSVRSPPPALDDFPGADTTTGHAALGFRHLSVFLNDVVPGTTRQGVPGLPIPRRPIRDGIGVTVRLSI